MRKLLCLRNLKLENYIPEKEDIDGDEYSNIIEITEFGSIEEINYEIFRIYRK